MTQPNPDLAVNASRLAEWNTPQRRRQSFRCLQDIHRRGLSFRAPDMLPLVTAENPAIPAVKGLLDGPSFCALVIAQGDHIVLQRHAADFATDRLHSIQSITKTFAHLALG
jgi:hypothetical protein